MWPGVGASISWVCTCSNPASARKSLHVSGPGYLAARGALLVAAGLHPAAEQEYAARHQTAGLHVAAEPLPAVDQAHPRAPLRRTHGAQQGVEGGAVVVDQGVVAGVAPPATEAPALRDDVLAPCIQATLQLRCVGGAASVVDEREGRLLGEHWRGHSTSESRARRVRQRVTTSRRGGGFTPCESDSVTLRSLSGAGGLMEPNTLLDALLEEASMSHAGLAARVNHAGQAAGKQLRYDHTAVARWIKGQRPRGRVPDLICSILTERLQRPIGLDDIGMGVSGATQAPGTPLSGFVERATALWRSDQQQRPDVHNAPTIERTAAIVPITGTFILPGPLSSI